MSRKHAEIAGGGVAGLIAAAALSQRGWSVRVHERSLDLRNYGAGISCWYNFVRVLKAVGAYDEAISKGTITHVRETRDEKDRLLWGVAKEPNGQEIAFSLTRGDLLTSVANAARRAGAEIVTGSKAVGAEADGTLCLDNGQRLKADLVVGADGVHSPVRDSLGLIRKHRKLREVTFRTLVPRQPEDEATGLTTRTVEFWSGKRRLFTSFLNKNEMFMAFTTSPNDPAAFKATAPKDEWIESFPLMRGFIERVQEGRWDQIQEIRLHSWSKGNVAIIGDAANAMSPNIGQGGGCAAMNALSLAVFASRPDDLAANLKAWETAERPLTEFTQTVSAFYGNFNLLPPRIRTSAMKLASNWKWLIELRQRPAKHMPTGFQIET